MPRDVVVFSKYVYECDHCHRRQEHTNEDDDTGKWVPEGWVSNYGWDRGQWACSLPCYMALAERFYDSATKPASVPAG